jgi:hypothetical protein
MSSALEAIANQIGKVVEQEAAERTRTIQEEARAKREESIRQFTLMMADYFDIIVPQAEIQMVKGAYTELPFWQDGTFDYRYWNDTMIEINRRCASCQKGFDFEKYGIKPDITSSNSIARQKAFVLWSQVDRSRNYHTCNNCQEQQRYQRSRRLVTRTRIITEQIVVVEEETPEQLSDTDWVQQAVDQNVEQWKEVNTKVPRAGYMVEPLPANMTISNYE